jgi:kynurenine formamidase
MGEPRTHREEEVLELFGKQIVALDLGREISPEMPHHPGLGAEATNWILDQGVVNVGTNATSLDNPEDVQYPGHTVHGQRLVIHTENLVDIGKIPKHDDFSFAMLPLKWMGLTGSPVRALALRER